MAGGIEQPKERAIRTHDNWISFEHRFGREESRGDVDLEVTGDIETFQIEMMTQAGRDRDNYHISHDSEIALNEDEARELYLLLHVWLEQRA